MTQTIVNGSEAPAALAHRPVRELLTGPVSSIGITLLVVVVVGLTWVGPRFLSASNVTIVGQFVAVPMLVGAFAGFALLAGVVDLSIGSMVGVSAAIFGALLLGGWGVLPAGAMTLLACLAFGGINAIAIVGFGADPIAATLGTLTGLRGATYVIVEANGQSGSLFAFNEALFAFTNESVWSLPLIFVLVLIVTAVAAVVVTRTRVGRHVRAAGGDPLAASRAGISVARVRTLALLLSAFGAGLGGILFVGQLGSVSRNMGFGLEFKVYAALMIGGYSILRGGVGNPVGGALGFLAIAGAANILDLRAISPYYADIIVGLLLLAAVLLDRLRGGDSYE
ncbi:MAG: ABC transporter permease [Hyphomicrobiales bacterium]|nr:ABC transporter permease [Hyphomicrobiales bacterium]